MPLVKGGGCFDSEIFQTLISRSVAARRCLKNESTLMDEVAPYSSQSASKPEAEREKRKNSARRCPPGTEGIPHARNLKGRPPVKLRKDEECPRAHIANAEKQRERPLPPVGRINVDRLSVGVCQKGPGPHIRGCGAYLLKERHQRPKMGSHSVGMPFQVDPLQLPSNLRRKRIHPLKRLRGAFVFGSLARKRIQIVDAAHKCPGKRIPGAIRKNSGCAEKILQTQPEIPRPVTVIGRWFTEAPSVERQPSANVWPPHLRRRPPRSTLRRYRRGATARKTAQEDGESNPKQAEPPAER